MYLILILMFIAYFTDAYQIFSIGTYGVTPLDILTLLFLIVFFKRILWDGDSLKITKNPALIFLLLLVLAVILSGITPMVSQSTDHITQYLKTTIHFLFLSSFALIAAIYPIKQEVWTNIIKIWLVLALLINVFGIYQIVARAYDLPLAWLDASNVSYTGRGAYDIAEYRQLSLRYGSFFRATSIFPEPSALAAFNLFIMSFIVVPFVQGRKQFFKSRFLTGIIFSSSLMALFLSFSLTAAAGLLMTFTIILLFQYSKRIFLFIPIFIISGIMVLVADNMVKSYADISVVNLFSKRIEGVLTSKREGNWVAGESFGGRLNNAFTTIEIWGRNPVFGCGTGLIGYDKEAKIGFSDYSVLTALAETGIIGFLSFISMFAVLFIICFRFIRGPDNNRLPESSARLNGILFYIMLHLFLTNFITGNNFVGFPLWNIIAIVFSIINTSGIALNKEHYSVRLVRVPLKERLGATISKYLDISEKAGKV